MPSSQTTLTIAFAITWLIVMLVFAAVVLHLFGLHTRALMSGAPVPMFAVLGMKLRRVDARAVIDAWIQARRENLAVTLADLESHLLSGGDLPYVMEAMIAAKRTGRELEWKQATAIDLAKRDVLEYVTSGAHERGQDWLSAAPLRRRQPLI